MPSRTAAAAARKAAEKSATVLWNALRAGRVDACTVGAVRAVNSAGLACGSTFRMLRRPTAGTPVRARSSAISSSMLATSCEHFTRTVPAGSPVHAGRGVSTTWYSVKILSLPRPAVWRLVRPALLWRQIPRKTAPLRRALVDEAPGHSEGRSTSPSLHPLMRMYRRRATAASSSATTIER